MSSATVLQSWSTLVNRTSWGIPENQPTKSKTPKDCSEKRNCIFLLFKLLESVFSNPGCWLFFVLFLSYSIVSHTCGRLCGRRWRKPHSESCPPGTETWQSQVSLSLWARTAGTVAHEEAKTFFFFFSFIKTANFAASSLSWLYLVAVRHMTIKDVADVGHVKPLLVLLLQSHGVTQDEWQRVSFMSSLQRVGAKLTVRRFLG